MPDGILYNVDARYTSLERAHHSCSALTLKVLCHCIGPSFSEQEKVLGEEPQQKIVKAVKIVWDLVGLTYLAAVGAAM